MDGIFLKSGAHESLAEGGCVMEFAAWVAGEPHSDHPQCVSPVIGQFLRSWNDALNDEDRQMLVPYAIAAVGTNTGADDEETRAWMCADWLVRTCAPAWLRLAKLHEHAEALANTPEVKDAASAEVARQRGDAAWAAAGNAARAAARAAAWDAAGNAARAAAWDAALAAARDAARAAARAAAGDALRPTVVALQLSALDLLDQMIAVGREPERLLEERVEVVRASMAGRPAHG